MPAHTRAQVSADVTEPAFDVLVWSGSAWVSVKSHVTQASARVDAIGSHRNAAVMGPSVSPEAQVELAIAGWSQATDLTPVRIQFGYGTSDLLTRFGGIITERGRGPQYGRWQLRGWNAHIERQSVRSPLFRRRPIATRTTTTSAEDPALSTSRAGLINYILWMCGGRPYEQAGAYPSALFYYRCSTALIGPEHSWIPGDNPWEVMRRLCRAAGGQMYQDGEGTICYVDPITLASGAPVFTFTDENLTAAQRTAQGKAGYEDIELEIDSTVPLTGVTTNFTSRLRQGEQQIYGDTTVRRIPASGSITVTCDSELPLAAVSGVAIDGHVTRTGAKLANGQVTVTPNFSSAQRVLVTLANTLTVPVTIDAVRVTGRPVSAGEQGSSSYIVSSANIITAEDNAYVQSERHAAMLSRMLYDGGATGGQLYRLRRCIYDVDRFLGEIVGLTSSEMGITNLRCRLVAIDTNGIWKDVVLAPLGSLPTRDSVHIIGSISGTKDLAY